MLTEESYLVGPLPHLGGAVTLGVEPGLAALSGGMSFAKDSGWDVTPWGIGVTYCVKVGGSSVLYTS
jgi:hypothetical protein